MSALELTSPRATSKIAVTKTVQSPHAIIKKGLFGLILSNAYPPKCVNNRRPMLPNKLRVPTIAPRISLGTVLRKSASMLDDCIADAMITSDDIAKASTVFGSFMTQKLDSAAARTKKEAGKVMWAPNLSEM